ncbi:3-carboxy-cis,cis-muconate cycloisomerase [Loktanella fryxellensis]|uniref:3-carboxy-cis,cis-muconate cycloisomerase n=1 Tax=Loktanella fryxellensis TaxID=245187 RepID=A0A1H7ZAS6_9RHOB|nr:3-carboxy-cis,cis-muconate cycloisomerase [Loktanella fryxellensis]SEM54579.1 3-carboxy-cis,cis-muconate cycloisomerase [Loktanella fryxellensis]
MSLSHQLYDGLFADAQMAALWDTGAQTAHMLQVIAALCTAQGQAGRVDPALAARAAAHVAGFVSDMADLSAGSGRDGLPVPTLIRQLKAGAGPAAAAIHAGATSQDVLDTVLALTLRATSDLIDARLADLSLRLHALADRFGGNPLMARTRMQAALPVAVADRIRQWQAPLADHRDRLRHLRPQTERLSLAGPTGTTDFGETAPLMAQALGLHAGPVWHTDRSGVVGFAGWLALVAGSLGKMGQDIALMAQQGVDEVTLSGGGGSSVMAHKHNPVLAELLVTLARFNAGQAGVMAQAMVHEQERSGAAWMLEWLVLPQMAQATGRALTAALTLTDGIAGMGHPEGYK